MIPKLLVIPFVFFITRAISQDQQTILQMLEGVNANRIKASMVFLADDLLEGRQPGTKGFAVASRYVESEFIGMGLMPGGTDGYRQSVPLKKGVVDHKESFLEIEELGATWHYGSDFIFAPNHHTARETVAAPLVFVGFGISAPEFKYDDYKGIDVRGKIVVMLDQAPDTFGNNERAYFSSPNVKLQQALDHGAIGVVTLNTSTRTSWEALVRRNAQGSFKWMDSKGIPHNSFESIKMIATINPSHHEGLFKLSGRELGNVLQKVRKGQPQSFPLKMRARCTVATMHSTLESSNLIGIVPGSHPQLKDEFVVYAAHLDHFGIGVPVKGDSIYNGAHDNASGVAILLEIARTFTTSKPAPKRSVIIAVVTGEESGLLGSDYFANNPTVNGRLVANLALDMPFFFHPVLDFVPYGAEHSSLKKQVDKAADILQLKISPDPFPEQVIFVRSDHFSFIKKGIPALFIKSGFMTNEEDTTDRSKSDVAWRSTTYHTPQDDMTQAFNFEGAATHVKINFLIGRLIADDAERPRWNAGDFFGKKFGK